jgi:hypothetical protein
MRRRNVTRKLLEAVKKLPQRSLLRRRTWQQLVAPSQGMTRINASTSTGTMAQLHDGTQNYALEHELWPDIPSVGLQLIEQTGERVWTLPPWVHYSTDGQPRLAQIAGDGRTVWRRETLVSTEFQVPILVAPLTVDGRWSGPGAPQWHLAPESDPESGYPPPLQGEDADRVVAVVTAGFAQPTPPLYFADL